MTELSVHLDGDGCWSDLADRPVLQGDLVSVASLAGGTENGKPSVAFRIELPDGQTVYTETTWSLFYMAAQAFEGEFGVPQ